MGCIHPIYTDIHQGYTEMGIEPRAQISTEFDPKKVQILLLLYSPRLFNCNYLLLVFLNLFNSNFK